MAGRDPQESHRASTPLELLFDLAFVVAVAQAAAALHHDLAEGAIGHGIVGYLIVFASIWWPWVNFTWFASAYDTDDVLYRFLTFAQIAGVLVMSAGVPAVFESLDFRVMLVGYVIMRIALVAQWLRVAREDPEHRRTALRFAGGIALVQVGWILRLGIEPPAGHVLLAVLFAAELLVPIWAESSGRHTPWHPEHITERYGLFTILVLGEAILAATITLQVAFTESGLTAALLAIVVGGLLLVFASWWMYFKDTVALGAGSLRASFAWGYGHFVIFAAVAAVGAGIQVAADYATDHAHVPAVVAAAAVAVPVAVFVVATGVLHRRHDPVSALRSVGPGAVLMLLTAVAAPWIGVPVAVLGVGALLAVVIAVHVVRANRASAWAAAPPSGVREPG